MAPQLKINRNKRQVRRLYGGEALLVKHVGAVTTNKYPYWHHNVQQSKSLHFILLNICYQERVFRSSPTAWTQLKEDKCGITRRKKLSVNSRKSQIAKKVDQPFQLKKKNKNLFYFRVEQSVSSLVFLPKINTAAATQNWDFSIISAKVQWQNWEFNNWFRVSESVCEHYYPLITKEFQLRTLLRPRLNHKFTGKMWRRVCQRLDTNCIYTLWN